MAFDPRGARCASTQTRISTGPDLKRRGRGTEFETKPAIRNLRAALWTLARTQLLLPTLRLLRSAAAGLHLGRYPVLQLERTYHFAEGAEGNGFVADGFSDPESWGRWTDGKNALLLFTLSAAPPALVTVAIEATSFSPAADRNQVVTLLANGRVCGQLVVSDGKHRAEVTCPTGALRTGNNVIRLRIANPARPKDLGTSADNRRLGLGLSTLIITPSE